MNTALFSREPYPTALPLWQRFLILTLTISAHAVLLSQARLYAHVDFASTALRELSVIIVQMSSSRNVTAIRPATPISLATEHQHAEPVKAEAPPDILQPDQVQTAGHMLASTDANIERQPTASGLPDHEPDYRAAYLNNPQPGYPLVARRMGWQGRVVLNIEVLADGFPGEVVVQQSSGREILDEAALRAVIGWRFIPARRSGYAVAQRYLVPIKFNLQ